MLDKLTLYFTFFSVILILMSSCVPTEFKNDIVFDAEYEDKTTEKIFDFAVDRNIDSLMNYLNHENPNYRYKAVRGIATYSGFNTIDSVVPLLSDQYIPIRTYAAYALGKSGNSDYTTDLIQAFDSSDSLKRKAEFNSAILEAVGKIGGEEELFMLATISNYRGSDTLLQLGRMRGILELVSRGINDKVTFKELGKIVSTSTNPDLVKCYAAYALNRQKDFSIDSIFYELKTGYNFTKSKELKITILKALSSCESASCKSFQEKVLDEEKDEDLRLLAFQALSKSKSISNTEYAAYISDKNRYISEIAADHFYRNGSSSQAETYISWAQKNNNFPATQGKLYAAGLKFLPYYYAVTKAQVFSEVKTHFANKKNPYEKLPYLLAISEDPTTYQWVISNGLNSELAILRTKSSLALLDIVGNKHFNSIFRGKSNAVKNEILDAIHSKIEKLDVGIISELGQRSLNSTIPEITKNKIISVADKLYTSESYEAYYFAQKVARKEVEMSPAQVLSIDTLQALKNNKKYIATISTNKGDIALELKPDLAPITVANFILLASQAYYDNKYFHRVVPNFVIQAGCNRGDGYGSLDYIIPTETGMIYYDKPGLVGMASLGSDTESAQWFITHTMTPHLNGRYTIFAEVTEGMDVVGKMCVGDKIKSITISKI